MAQNPDNKELRLQALQALTEGREEMSLEVNLIQEELSPARVLKRVVDRHAGLLTVLAITAGVIPALLIIRSRRSRTVAAVTVPPPKPVVGALLLGAAGLLARSITPVLIKSIILPRVRDFMARSQPETTNADQG
jgi:hypothetical protein